MTVQIRRKSKHKIVLSALLDELPVKVGNNVYRILAENIRREPKLCIMVAVRENNEYPFRIDYITDDIDFNWFLKQCEELTEKDIVNIVFMQVQAKQAREQYPDIEHFYVKEYERELLEAAKCQTD
jgi:hypothetical protein